MTTTSEKILSEMERMGRMKIKDLCAQMHWQYQKFRRRIKANDFSPEDRERTKQVYDFGTDIISETLGDMWDGRLPDDQRQAILQRIDRAVSRYWQHPFRRGQDGNDHPIDPKTGDYTDGYHE